MEKSLARYIWTHTSKQQLWILLIVLLSMPTYFMSLDLPKYIVNGPIQGKGFETEGATQKFLSFQIDLPDWISTMEPIAVFSGFSLDRFQMLMALSGVFLLLVIINGLFKFYINTYKGRLGERMLRRIRFELVDRVLRFPPSVFKRMKASEVATMVKDEVEPLGGFIGDAFVQPALLGGQALTALIFILVQNFWLGLIAGSIVGVQGYVIPRLRRRLIFLGKERQLTARQLAGRVGEIVDGMPSIHAHDTSNYERADIASRLARIFKIRYDLYQWKFFVKFLNNFLAQVTPFLFYAIGGWLALRGQLDIGQLVAVIAAYKDLPSPIKDLIDWDQQRVDVQVKYAQVVEQFHVEQLVDPKIQALVSDPIPPITAPIAFSSFSASDDSGARLLEKISLDIKPGEKVAVVGTAGAGAEALADAIVRQLWPENGRISVGGSDLRELPEAVTGRRIAYASGDAHLFQGTVRDNLVYVLKHAPLKPFNYEGDLAIRRKWEVDEALKAGNPDYDLRSDWIDYASAGVANDDELFHEIVKALDVVALSQDVFDLGLRASVDPEVYPAIPGQIEKARDALQQRLEEEGLTGLVVSFDPELYNSEATVAENLLFGTPVGSALSDKNLASNAYFRSVLTQLKLDEDLYRMGVEIARNAVELFRDLPPDHPFFQQLIFMSAEELPEYQALLQRVQDRPYSEVKEADRNKMMALSFLYIEPRYRFGLLDESLTKRIVDARKAFHDGLPENLKSAIERYDPAVYNNASSVLDNVLFGRVGHKHVDGAERIRTIVRSVLDELELSDDVVKIGLDFNVGVGGRRLTAAQRQKLQVARALIKRADFIVLNKALSAVEQRAQEKIANDLFAEARAGGRSPAIIWVLSNPLLARLFDRVIVLDRGARVEDDKYDSLVQKKGVLSTILAS
jgi:putative ABC transport system ATP-binding protein